MIRAARLGFAFVLLTALLAAFANPASAVPLLDEGDATELAQALAEATEEQGVCYGWQVQVSDTSGGPSGIDAGSFLGPGKPVGASATEPCERTVELQGSVFYSCDSCESEDSSSVRVVANFDGGPTTSDLSDLGLTGGDLKNDNGDVVLTNMVGALPLLVSSAGQADAIAVQPSTAAPATTDKPTGTPSVPDWLRDSWLALTALTLLVIGGVIWLISAIGVERVRRQSIRHAVTPRPSDPTA